MAIKQSAADLGCSVCNTRGKLHLVNKGAVSVGHARLTSEARVEM